MFTFADDAGWRMIVMRITWSVITLCTHIMTKSQSQWLFYLFIIVIVRVWFGLGDRKWMNFLWRKNTKTCRHIPRSLHRTDLGICFSLFFFFFFSKQKTVSCEWFDLKIIFTKCWQHFTGKFVIFLEKCKLQGLLENMFWIVQYNAVHFTNKIVPFRQIDSDDGER